MSICAVLIAISDQLSIQSVYAVFVREDVCKICPVMEQSICLSVLTFTLDR